MWERLRNFDSIAKVYRNRSQKSSTYISIPINNFQKIQIEAFYSAC